MSEHDGNVTLACLQNLRALLYITSPVGSHSMGTFTNYVWMRSSEKKLCVILSILLMSPP